jgi:hypothetical protein
MIDRKTAAQLFREIMALPAHDLFRTPAPTPPVRAGFLADHALALSQKDFD